MNTLVYKALSDENRLRILNILMEKELCVCEIEDVLDMSQSNVSRHLNKLKYSGIVDCKKESQWVFYEISGKFKESYSNLCEQLKRDFDLDEVFIEDRKKLACSEIRLEKCRE